MKENGFALKARSKRYPAVTITHADYAGNLVLLENTPAQAESLLHRLEQAARDICLYVNSNKSEFMFFNQDDAILLSGKPLKSFIL